MDDIIIQRFDTLENLVKETREDIRGIERALFLGNGRKSIMERLEGVETKVDHNSHKIESIDIYKLRRSMVATTVCMILIGGTFIIDGIYKSDIASSLINFLKGII